MTKLTHTHTVVNLGISPAAFDEIVALLREAGYDHVFLEDGSADMSGIAIVRNADDFPAKNAFEWKPMDSAPRDGTVILLRWGVDGVTPGFWVGEFGDKPESCGAFPWAFIDADSTEQNTYILNQAADNEYGHTHWAPYSAEVFDCNVEDAKVGRRWREDSSLETWFPLTAEELLRLKEEVKQLRATLVIGNHPVETTEDKARRIGVPLIPRLPPDRRYETNPVVSVCGECGMEIRLNSSYSCGNTRCPVQPKPWA